MIAMVIIFFFITASLKGLEKVPSGKFVFWKKRPVFFCGMWQGAMG